MKAKKNWKKYKVKHFWVNLLSPFWIYCTWNGRHILKETEKRAFSLHISIKNDMQFMIFFLLMFLLEPLNKGFGLVWFPLERKMIRFPDWPSFCTRHQVCVLPFPQQLFKVTLHTHSKHFFNSATALNNQFFKKQKQKPGIKCKCKTLPLKNYANPAQHTSRAIATHTWPYDRNVRIMCTCRAAVTRVKLYD